MTNELITDAIVEAARQADELHDPERMECLNHDGSCCPAFDHNVGDERTHRVRAALEAAAPLIAAKAWEEGYAAYRTRPLIDGYLINRSNPYQARADAIARDPLDESDHRPRIDSDGDRVEWSEANRDWACDGGSGCHTLAEYAEEYAPITGWADL